MDTMSTRITIPQLRTACRLSASSPAAIAIPIRMSGRPSADGRDANRTKPATSGAMATVEIADTSRPADSRSGMKPANARASR